MDSTLEGYQVQHLFREIARHWCGPGKGPVSFCWVALPVPLNLILRVLSWGLNESENFQCEGQLCTSISETEETPVNGRWMKDHTMGLDVRENLTQATLNLIYWSWKRTGVWGKGNAEPMTWLETEPRAHFFLWSFVIFSFSPTLKIETAFRCFLAVFYLILCKYVLSLICLSNRIVSPEGWF